MPCMRLSGQSIYFIRSAETILLSYREIKICGALSCSAAMDMMSSARRAVDEKKSPGFIFILEHDPPVITLGRNRGEESILASSDEIRSLGYEIYKTSRGGDATVHETGQAVIYIVEPVKGKSSASFVSGWCRVISSFLSDEYGVAAEFNVNIPGLFIADRKIASVGFDLTGGISSHGIAVNVCNTLEGFKLISPCGYRSAEMTTLSVECGRLIEFDEFAEKLKARLLLSIIH